MSGVRHPPGHTALRRHGCGRGQSRGQGCEHGLCLDQARGQVLDTAGRIALTQQPVRPFPLDADQPDLPGRRIPLDPVQRGGGRGGGGTYRAQGSARGGCGLTDRNRVWRVGHRRFGLLQGCRRVRQFWRNRGGFGIQCQQTSRGGGGPLLHGGGSCAGLVRNPSRVSQIEPRLAFHLPRGVGGVLGGDAGGSGVVPHGTAHRDVLLQRGQPVALP